MSSPFIGEIRMFAGNFAPAGWVLCQGQLMPISENETLFNLIGTTYGGDGQETFALPNLQSRVPVHKGQVPGCQLRDRPNGGVETVTLTTQPDSGAQSRLVPSQRRRRQRHGAPPAMSWPTRSLGHGGRIRCLHLCSRPTRNQRCSAPMRSAPPAAASRTTTCSRSCCINFIISLFGIFPSQN